MIVCLVLTFIDHLLANIFHHLDTRFMSLDLSLQALVFLHQILYTDKITPSVGGRSDGFFLANPRFLIIDVSHQLMHAVLLVQLLLTSYQWGLNEIKHTNFVQITSRYKYIININKNGSTETRGTGEVTSGKKSHIPTATIYTFRFLWPVM